MLEERLDRRENVRQQSGVEKERTIGIVRIPNPTAARQAGQGPSTGAGIKSTADATMKVNDKLQRGWGGDGTDDLHTTTARQVKEAMHYIKKHNLVVTYLDKSANTLCIEPMHTYIKLMHEVVVKDELHFQKVDMDENQVTQAYKQYYKDHGLSRLGTFSTEHKIPEVYLLRKAKDIARFRPIVDASQLPLGLMLARVATALMHMLMTSPLAKHNITQIQHLAKIIGVINRRVRKLEMRGKFHKGELTLSTFDVKEMFTNLEHSKIIEAAQQLITFHKMRQGHTCISVTRNSERQCTFERRKNKRLATCFEFADIIALITFELSLSYFKVGKDCIMKQKVGVFMGGHLSPVLAMLVACTAEQAFDLAMVGAKLSASLNINRYTRFVDDHHADCYS